VVKDLDVVFVVVIDARALLAHKKEAEVEAKSTPQRIEGDKTDLKQLGSGVQFQILC
jgi:hypothetical protein